MYTVDVPSYGTVRFLDYTDAVRRLAALWERGATMSPLYRLTAELFGVPASRVQSDVLDAINA